MNMVAMCGNVHRAIGGEAYDEPPVEDEMPTYCVTFNLKKEYGNTEERSLEVIADSAPIARQKAAEMLRHRYDDEATIMKLESY